MGFRQIYIEKAKRLSTADNCLEVIRGDEKSDLSFPIEDLDLIFVEDPNVVLSACLLSALSDKGVSLIVCGKNYLPSAQVVPFNGYYKQSESLWLQIDQLPSKKNKLWELIIRQKILNQAAVIEHTVNDEKSFSLLRDYASQVKSGDEKNMEGIAARVYFRALFGENFIRFGESAVTSALNYGYSILTGAIIRSLAANGLNGSLGIWHRGAQNANNLACDFVEPFRQVVDYFVYQHLSEITIPLSKACRGGLINLLNYSVEVRGKKFQVSYAISQFVSDYLVYLRTGDIAQVGFPAFFVNEENAVE
jgi:CRISPR-associated protein Cas1